MNRVAEVLGIEKPIIQGPMFWLTNAELVSAVSNAGGLGVLGISAGQYEPTKSVEETFKQMREQIQKTKKLTEKPFAVNLSLSDGDPETDVFANSMVQLLIEEKVPVAIISAFSYVSKWFEILKENGIKTVFRPATPTTKIVKEAIEKGVDAIVATGFDEGGTVPEKVIGTFSIIPAVVDMVDGKVPVIAAGGITDERTAKAAFALGAEGLFVGTAFLAAKESPMADNIKQQVLKLGAEDMLMYRALPAYYRSIPGALPNHLVEMDSEGATNADIFKTGGNYAGMRTGMLLGDLSHGYASFGLGISMIHSIDSVKDIVDRLYAGIPVESR